MERLLIRTTKGGEMAEPAGAGIRVLSAYPPRLYVVECEALPGGFAAVGRDDEIPSDLSEGERLFAAGWQQSKRPKTRRGEGLSWDAPGFEPPDDPKKR